MAGATVRLTQVGGAVIDTPVDTYGRWQVRLPADTSVRLFELSMHDHDRPVQAEGVLAVTPQGVFAQLRAGAGALVLQAPSAQPRILAVDFDRQGGAVVSGMGAPGTSLSMWVDGMARGAIKADPAGRFFLAFAAPLTPGAHLLSLIAGDQSDQVEVQIAPVDPTVTGAFRAVPEAAGWRVDWLTPGGGRQSTLLITRRRHTG